MTEILEAFKAKRAEIGTKELADALGIKDSAVRMVCTGNYPNPHNILNQFARHFINVVACPYAGRTIERDECKQRSSGPPRLGDQQNLTGGTPAKLASINHEQSFYYFGRRRYRD